MAPLPDVVVDVFNAVPARYWAAAGVLVVGLVAGWIVGLLSRGLLTGLGVPEAVEGTPFERTLQDFGSSTVAVIAKLSTYFVWGLTVVLVLTVGGFDFTSQFWPGVIGFLPRTFIAVLVLIVGVVVGDKVELLVNELLRGYKAPQVGLVGRAAKYTVFFVAVLIALGQLGIAVQALLIVLAVYVFGAVFLGGLAFRDMLASGAAGMWLLLNEPFGIGDSIRVGERRGIVQEVDVFVTTVENDEGTEYIIPNRQIFRDGVIRLRS